MSLKEKEMKPCESILNQLILCVFCSMAIPLLSEELFLISSLLRRPDPVSSNQNKLQFSTHAPGACMVMQPAQSTAAPVPFLDARCWRGMTGTDSQ